MGRERERERGTEREREKAPVVVKREKDAKRGKHVGLQQRHEDVGARGLQSEPAPQ